MNLDYHVNVTISLNALTVQRAGFGTPILLAYFPTTIFADRTRTYRASTALSSLVADGFATTHPVYRMAQALIGADIQVEQFKIGRLALPHTQDTKFIATSTTEGDEVGFDIIDTDGTEYACYYTVQAGDVINDVAVGLKAAIDAHALAITIAAPVADTINMVADTAGDIFYFHSINGGGIYDVTPDPGIATDLAAIDIADDDWYGLVTSVNSFAIIDAVAGWVETQRRIYQAQSQDSDVPTSATDDIGSELDSDARLRSNLIHVKASGSGPLSEYPAAAWVGKCFPKDPGSQTWAFKSLSGVTPSTYTATEIGYLDAKNVNHYVTFAGVNVTRSGTMGIDSTTFIDEVRLKDWLQARCQENVFQLMVSNDKIPYSDKGINMIRGAILSAYTEGARNGGLILAAFSFDALPAAEQATADIASRTVRDIVFGGLFSNGIHTAYITGNVQ